MNPLVSLIIPTKDSAKYLKECLQSIKNQIYKNVEIIIVDAGSKDKTLEIAKKFKARIYHNPKVLAEPAVDLGLDMASGEFCTILAADNFLGNTDWIEKMIKPFSDKKIFVTYPKQCFVSQDDFWINKYINVFTDPVNHFIYGEASNTRTFEKIYKPIKKTNDYVIYDFHPQNHPILALAQGTTIRKGYKRPETMRYDDILPIIDLLEKGWQMAYVPEARLVHKSITSISQFVKKQRWAVDNALTGTGFGFSSREKYFTGKRKVRKYLFLPYALSFLLPLLRSLYHLIIDKETTWIYHPFIAWLTGIVVWQELVKIKILGQEAQVGR